MKDRKATIDDLKRPILIDLCKDGTISFRLRVGGRMAPRLNDAAIPVFSVDTLKQAQDLQVMFCRKQYGSHPEMPNQDWYRWTDFPGTLEAAEEVTDRLRTWFAGRKAMRGKE